MEMTKVNKFGQMNDSVRHDLLYTYLNELRVRFWDVEGISLGAIINYFVLEIFYQIFIFKNDWWKFYMDGKSKNEFKMEFSRKINVKLSLIEMILIQINQKIIQSTLTFI